jgi:hypothetical protein
MRSYARVELPGPWDATVRPPVPENRDPITGAGLVIGVDEMPHGDAACRHRSAERRRHAPGQMAREFRRFCGLLLLV